MSTPYTVIDWHKLPPFVVSSIYVKGTLTLTHNKSCKTSITFEELVPVPDAMQALKAKLNGPGVNRKITGNVKMAQHITVQGHVLGRVMGEAVSRHLNGGTARDWIKYCPGE